MAPQDSYYIYQSNFGWSLRLPTTWKRLSPTSPNVAAIAVFSTPLDWSLALNWMLSPLPVSDQAAARFNVAGVFLGRISVEEANNILQPIFPPIGQLKRAEMIQLADGVTALESEEFITESADGTDSNPTKYGYQLVFPVIELGAPVHFQRLTFYAEPEAYSTWIQTIRGAARSFHYSVVAKSRQQTPHLLDPYTLNGEFRQAYLS